MQKVKSALWVLCIILSLWVKAQPVLIKGIAPSYNGKEIAAYSFKDLITYTPVKIGSCQVNDSGRFSIDLPGIKTSQYIYLNIDNLQGSMYIAPGNTYHVIFPPPDSTHYQNPYVTHLIDLSFIVTDSDNINNLVIDFNQQFDTMWAHCYMYFVEKRGPHYLDSFYVAMQHRYEKVNNPYFKAYIQYNVAEIGINILEGHKTLGKKYIEGKPVLYHSYEYMKFFNDYFDHYLEQFALTGEGADVAKYVQSVDINGLKEVMKINPMFKANDSLCELVMLKGLYEMYYGGNYNKDNIKIMLNLIGRSSKITESKIIAEDVLNSFSTVMSGVTSPDFALKDSKGVVTSILDFRGKYLYLCFFKSTSNTSLSELDVIATLNKKYGKKINFVCISEDDKLGDLQHFLEQNKNFTWTFLFDVEGKTLAKYDVKALPEFFLINQQGRFMLSPADSPSHGIEMTFDKLLERKKTINQQ